MKINELKFDSVFDVASCFKDEKNIKLFLMKFFEVAYSVNKKSDWKFTAIIKTKKYYNVDYELLLFSFFEFLKSQGINELELSKVQLMFRKDTEGNLKNNLFFVHVLVYFDLVPTPKGSYFYLRTLHFNSEKKNYFSFNSIGLNESSLVYYIGREFLDEHIEPKASDIAITTFAMGQKNVNIFIKEKRIIEKEVLKSQEFLG